MPKPGTLLNKALSPNRLVGRHAELLGGCWTLALLRNAVGLLAGANGGAGTCFKTPPLLQFDADELPDVVDSESKLFAVTLSNCERKPRLFFKSTAK